MPFAAATAVPLAAQQAEQQIHSHDHHLANEQQVGPTTTLNESLNTDSVWAPETDNGTMLPFKYSLDLLFLEVFPTGTYRDISAAEWLAHTPARLVDEHLHTGEDP